MMPKTPSAPAGPDSPQSPGIVEEVDETLVKLMPWAISILLHVAIVVVAMLLVWTTIMSDEPEVEPVQAFVVNTPDAPQPLSQEPLVRSDDSAPLSPTAPASNAQSLADLARPIVTPVNDPRMGALRPAQPNVRPGSDITGGGIGYSGKIIPSVSANRMIYVIDASGSLVDTFPFIINELRQTLDAMGKARAGTGRPLEFAVIFFRNGGVVEMGGPGTGLARGLKPATPENIAKALAWLRPTAGHIGPGGKTDPMPAIELALRYNPQVVVLLSDNITGQGIHALDPDGLVQAVMDARGDRHIVFDTVQFLYPDPAEGYGQRGALERLAEQTSGRFRFVSARELDLR